MSAPPFITGMIMQNRYYKITKPVPAWALVGYCDGDLAVKAQTLENVYVRAILAVFDEIHELGMVTWVVVNDGAAAVEIRLAQPNDPNPLLMGLQPNFGVPQPLVGQRLAALAPEKSTRPRKGYRQFESARIPVEATRRISDDPKNIARLLDTAAVEKYTGFLKGLLKVVP